MKSVAHGLPPKENGITTKEATALRLGSGLREVSTFVILLMLGVAAFGGRRCEETLDIVHRDLPIVLQPVPATTFVRPTDTRHCKWFSWAEPPKRIEEPGLLLAAFPAGRAFDVMIRGELSAILDDLDDSRRRREHVLQAVEMKYRRTIESNDGYRVVERRDFETVRRAKLLVPVGAGQVSSCPFATWSLDEVPFPSSAEGIYIVPAQQLATSLLRPEACRFVERVGGRGFLEEDDLSGRSIRLTHVDGVGIESLETLGWHANREQLQYLAAQSIFLQIGLSKSVLSDERHPDILSKQFSELVPDPFTWIRRNVPIRVTRLNEVPTSLTAQTTLQLRVETAFPDNPGDVNVGQQVNWMRGILDYDNHTSLLKSAVMRYHANFLLWSRYHLFFETTTAESNADFVVSYRCSVRQ